MRRVTREVFVGRVGIGGNHPIRIQSMTKTPTSDVEKTTEQIIRLEEAGCEIVRMAVQGIKEASACETIKNRLVQKGSEIPLVADIHFFPKAAMTVIDFVDKVRINPGNYVDKRATFNKVVLDESDYAAELERLHAEFSPLVEKCKKLKKALRIGVNHGSLSDRILTRYGDTPEGMVMSAVEFAEVARRLDFHDFLFSMKASNPRVMITAYRQLVDKMEALGWDYPLHLGVTEAGADNEGRIKSAIGMGALLLDGIGDTLRVSLTEDPENEIEPARTLIALTEKIKPKERLRDFKPKKTLTQAKLYLSLTDEELNSTTLRDEIDPVKCDGLVVKKVEENANKIEELQRAGFSILEETSFFFPKERCIDEALHASKKAERPLLLRSSYDLDDPLFLASLEMGVLLVDKVVDGILLEAPISLKERLQLSQAILQAAMRRIYKAEFISCPGCGRTLFDLQTVSKEIREKTAHLIGLKIAVMGCIVNGPGEMADADFGYVGSAPGKIDLFAGKKCVHRGIEREEAVEKLIQLIKSEGRWIDPPVRGKQN